MGLGLQDLVAGFHIQNIHRNIGFALVILADVLSHQRAGGEQFQIIMQVAALVLQKTLLVHIGTADAAYGLPAPGEGDSLVRIRLQAIPLGNREGKGQGNGF